MKKMRSPMMNLGGGIILNPDGSPNTRALMGRLQLLGIQMDELADDIEFIKKELIDANYALDKIMNKLGLIHRTGKRR